LLFLRETFDASSARDVHDVYEFHIDDSVISVIVDDGEMQVIEGQTGRPVDVEIHIDAATFIEVGLGRRRGRDSIRQGKLRLVGSEAALRRYSSIIRPLARAGLGGSHVGPPRGAALSAASGTRSKTRGGGHDDTGAHTCLGPFMSKYVALLRGVNVAGKKLLKMTELKACFEAHGFRSVQISRAGTYCSSRPTHRLRR
jgi:hypothetical protein